MVLFLDEGPDVVSLSSVPLLGNTPTAISCLGDVDGDGLSDLVVGRPIDFVDNVGQVDILFMFMNADGSVKSSRSIGDLLGGFTPALGSCTYFGTSVAGLGDLDGNGTPDLAVGAPNQGAGVVVLLFLNADGSLLSSQSMGDGQAAFSALLEPGDLFGHSLAMLGDLDGNGSLELAVGAPGDDDGGPDRGALWVLSLAPDGTLGQQRKISQTMGGFPSTLPDGGRFGSCLAFGPQEALGGSAQLTVGSEFDGPGAVWLLQLADPVTPDGPLLGGRFDKFDETSPPVSLASLAPGDRFGGACAWTSDVDGDFLPDLVVGARLDDAGPSGIDEGTIYLVRPRTSHWNDLGHALASSQGLPRLVGSGDFQMGDPSRLELSEAAPLAPALLIVGLAQHDVPFLGGVLVPRVDWLVGGLVVGSIGRLALEATLPLSVPHVGFHFQFWIVDETAPMGFSASNGIVARLE